MLKQQGFSILEVMVAVAIIASVGLGIYRLQVSSLASIQQSLIHQQAIRSANNLINELYPNVLYQNRNNLKRDLPVYETAYSDNTSLTIDCSTQACTSSNMEKFILYRWKSQLAAAMNLPQNNVKAILCRDGGGSVPTLSAPNCSGTGTPVVKIAWQSHIADSESALLGDNNYILLRISLP